MTDPTTDIATLLARAIEAAFPVGGVRYGEWWSEQVLATPSGKAILDRLARAEAVVAVLDEHLPSPGAHGDFVWCGCGWRTDETDVAWSDHIRLAARPAR
jgi:hypothetical protein